MDLGNTISVFYAYMLKTILLVEQHRFNYGFYSVNEFSIFSGFASCVRITSGMHILIHRAFPHQTGIHSCEILVLATTH